LALLKVLYFSLFTSLFCDIIMYDIASDTGHVGTVYGLAMIETPGHVRLVSASYDKTLRVCICVVVDDVCYVCDRFGV